MRYYCKSILILFLFSFQNYFCFNSIPSQSHTLSKEKSFEKTKQIKKTLRIRRAEYSLLVDKYTISDGLVNNRIRALFQDNEGFIWVGTSEGLSIFDGKDFRNFSKSNGYPINSVIAIYESKYSPQDIWLSSNEDGVFRVSDEKFQPLKFPTKDSSNIAFCFYEDSDKMLWIGTRQGLYYLKNNKLKKAIPDLKFESVKNIFTYNDSLMILVSDYDSYLFNRKSYKCKIISLNLKPPNEYVIKGIQDNERNIWLGLIDGSVIKIDDSLDITKYNFGGGYSVPGLVDSKGELWLGNIEGLFKLNLKKQSDEIILFNKKNGLPAESYLAFLEDREGNIWLGNYSEGLIKIKNQNLLNFPIDNPIKALSDINNHIWILTTNELFEYWLDNDDNWNIHKHKLSRKNKNIRNSTFSITENRLVISLVNSEIMGYKINYNKGKHSSLIPEFYTIMSDLIYDISTDESGRFWLAQKGKITSFKKSFDSDLIKIKLPSNNSVFRINKGKNNELFLSLFEKGAFKVTKGINQNRYEIERISSLSNYEVRTIFQTNSGTLFAGTSLNGLIKISYNHVSSFDHKNGLQSNSIWNICEGKDKKIWIATSNGLCYMDNENSSKIYNNNLIYNNWVFNCGTIADNIVWAVSKNGLLIYYNGKQSRTKYEPPIYIRNIFINGKKIDFKNEYVFGPNQNNCEVEFIAVTYNDEQSFKYQYSIGNNKEEWSSPTTDNKISFAALKPGKYKFSVRAIGSNNAVSRNTASWSFEILSPLWQRWWFILASVLILLTFTIIVFRSRINRVRHIERLRTQIASDLHDDLASNLSSITIFSKIIQDRPEEINNLIERIINISKDSVNSIKDIIWAIDPKVETIEDLLLRLQDFCMFNCRANNIRLFFEFDPEANFPSSNLSPELRKNIWLILKETINNSIKHSKATELIVRTFYNNNRLLVIIKDNGKGFETNKEYPGRGLETMKRRAEDLGGNLIIKSNINFGTETEFTLKI